MTPPIQDCAEGRDYEDDLLTHIHPDGYVQGVEQNSKHIERRVIGLPVLEPEASKLERHCGYAQHL